MKMFAGCLALNFVGISELFYGLTSTIIMSDKMETALMLALPVHENI